MKIRPIAAALAFGALFAPAATLRAEGEAPEAAPTYARDIAPIIYSRCAECHHPGQIGPMSLTSYEEVRPWAKGIKKSVGERSMPPWDADPAYGVFKNDARLKDEEIALIARWVDAGAPAGDLAQAPAPPKFDEGGWRFGKPDQVFAMEPFKLGDDVEDSYEHFTIQTNLTEDKWISAMEIKAGAPSAVHHVLVFLSPEGESVTNIMEGGAILRSTFITGWAPGTNAVVYQEGFGKKLPAGSAIVLQVHYHKTPGPGTGVTDQTAVAVKYASSPLKHPTTTAWIMDPGIEIPPGEPNYESVSKFEFRDEGWILGFVPHMHLRGKDFQFIADFPDGRSETLLSVPNYDFNWQLAYEFAEPREMPKGTVVRAIAHWDNSAANPNNPDPTQTVYFGESTTEEMMIGFMEYAYKTNKGMQAKFGMPEGMVNIMGGKSAKGAKNAMSLIQKVTSKKGAEGGTQTPGSE